MVSFLMMVNILGKWISILTNRQQRFQLLLLTELQKNNKISYVCAIHAALPFQKVF